MPSTLLNIHHYPSAASSHAHAAHSQLVFGLHGSLELEVSGRGARVDSAGLAIIAPGDEHTFLSRDNGRCLVLDIAPQQRLAGLDAGLDEQQRLLGNSALRSLSPQQMALVQSLAGIIQQQPGLADAGASLLLGSLLQPQVGTNKLPMASLDAYIDAHLAYPIEIIDLARLTNISSSRLRHWFSVELGCSPIEYVRRRRLHFAHQLLQAGREPVAMIAERCGYSSQSAFAQAFKHHWGQSPRAVRQQQAVHNNSHASGDTLSAR